MDDIPLQEKLVLWCHLCEEVPVILPKFGRAGDVDLQNLFSSGSVYKVLRDDYHGNDELEDKGKGSMMIEEKGICFTSKESNSSTSPLYSTVRWRFIHKNFVQRC